jgi:hypothetical protein
MSKRTVDVATFRRDMKELGYGVSTRGGSQFVTATVKKDGVAINGGNVLTPDHLAQHRAFYDYRNATSVMDGGMRVML